MYANNQLIHMYETGVHMYLEYPGNREENPRILNKQFQMQVYFSCLRTGFLNFF